MTFYLKIIKNHRVSPYIFYEDLILIFLPVNFQLSPISLSIPYLLATYYLYEYYYPHFVRKVQQFVYGHTAIKRQRVILSPDLSSKLMLFPSLTPPLTSLSLLFFLFPWCK